MWFFVFSYCLEVPFRSALYLDDVPVRRDEVELSVLVELPRDEVEELLLLDWVDEEVLLDLELSCEEVF